MSANPSQNMHTKDQTVFFLFRGDVQRSILYLTFAIVTLWVSVDVTDSTILKPYLLIALAFLVSALWLGEGLHRGTVLWRKSPVDLWIASSFLLLILSFIFSDYRIFGTQALLTACASVLCFFCGSQLFDDQRKIDRAIDILALITLVVCVIAALQFLSGDNWGIDFGMGSDRRVMSTMGNPTYLAGYLIMIFPMALAKVLSSGNRNRKLLWTGLGVLIMITLFLTRSRSGILAGSCAVFLFIILLNRRNPRGIALAFIAAAATCGLLLIAMPGMSERLLSLLDPMQDHSFTRRLPFWEAGWNAVISAPLLGHGPGSIPFVIMEFRRPDYWMGGSEDIVPHIHNEVLEVAIESGMLGGVLFCLVGVLVLSQGFRKGASIPALGLSCAIVAIMLDNVTGVSLRHAPVAMIAWFFSGLLFSQVFQQGAARQLRIRFAGRRIAAFLPLVLWCGFAYVYAEVAVAKQGSDKSLQSGRVAVRAGKQAIASDHFREALRQDSTNLLASYELCIAQLRSGEYRGALATAGKLREMSPSYPKVRLLEALAWLELDSLRLARLAIDEELKRRDHPEAFYTQSLIAARMDDTSGVRSSLEQVLERNIASYTTIHLEGTCRTLLALAQTPEDLQRFATLLEQLDASLPPNKVLKETLDEVRRRLREKTRV